MATQRFNSKEHSLQISFVFYWKYKNRRRK